MTHIEHGLILAGIMWLTVLTTYIWTSVYRIERSIPELTRSLERLIDAMEKR